MLQISEPAASSHSLQLQPNQRFPSKRDRLSINRSFTWSSWSCTQPNLPPLDRKRPWAPSEQWACLHVSYRPWRWSPLYCHSTYSEPQDDASFFSIFFVIFLRFFSMKLLKHYEFWISNNHSSSPKIVCNSVSSDHPTLHNPHAVLWCKLSLDATFNKYESVIRIGNNNPYSESE